MKKLSVGILLIGVLAGCGKDFLNRAPLTSTSTDNFYKTSNDMVNAVNAAYASLYSAAAVANEYIFGDVPTDDAGAVSALCAQGHCDFDLYATRPSGTAGNHIQNRWNDGYRAISRCNIVLDRIGPVPMDQTLKDRLIGEVKFLRAYYYFNLVKIYGNVPIVLKEIKTPDEALEYGRDTTTKVFEQIEKDFTEAIAALPATYVAADAGRATSGAAKGMLARILLFQSKHAQAAPLLKSIIETQSPAVYDLLPKYKDVFRFNNGNNKEILFAVQYSTGGNGLGGSPTNGFNTTNANQPTVDLYYAYEAGDTRRDSTITITGLNGNTFSSSFATKFLDSNFFKVSESATDYPILRYADVLLMYAECLNEANDVNGALPYINKVRQRSSLAALQTNDPATTATYVSGQANLRDRIMQERRMEFAFEGLRFFDLVRTNRLVSVMNAYFIKYGINLTISNNNKLFPVPQQQIDVNPGKIKQNPGYM